MQIKIFIVTALFYIELYNPINEVPQKVFNGVWRSFRVVLNNKEGVCQHFIEQCFDILSCIIKVVCMYVCQNNYGQNFKFLQLQERFFSFF